MFAPRFDPFVSENEDIHIDDIDSKVQERKRKLSTTSSEEALDDDDEDGDGDEADEAYQGDEKSKNFDRSQDIDSASIDNDSGESDALTSDTERTNKEEGNDTNNEKVYDSKYKSVFDKFRTSVAQKVNEQVGHTENLDPEGVESQNLGPMPQPQLPKDKFSKPKESQSKNLDWIATPKYVSPDMKKPFSELNPSLSSLMQRNLSSMGYTEAFSVQISVIEMLLEDIKKTSINPDTKSDLLINAATGSGKTLAYVVPIVESLHKRIVPRVRAIILVPTKPLISQVKATFHDLCRGTNLSVVSLRNDISIREESSRLRSHPPDVIISTPGRLVEHLTTESVNLKNLQYLVIDEADRLLNQSFQNWCRVLMSAINKYTQDKEKNISNFWRLRVQRLIFSATLTTNISELMSLELESPRLVVVNEEHNLVNEMFTLPSTLKEYKLKFGSSKSALKPLILAKFLLEQNKLRNVLVFAMSSESSMRLSWLLSSLLNNLQSAENILVAYINSTNNTVTNRAHILKSFSTGSINILVATDLIARGIDILSITDVVNYDTPNSSRDYVHRVGRTARALQSGFAYNFLFGKGEEKWFSNLTRNLGRGGKHIEDFSLDFFSSINENEIALYREYLEELKQNVVGRK